MRSGCPIHTSGTLAGRFKRQSPGEWQWDKALSVAETWQAAASWTPEGKEPEKEPPGTPDLLPARTTMNEMTQACLSKCKGRDIESPTVAKYKTFTNLLEANWPEKQISTLTNSMS